jgi:hypothetical protein
MVGKTDPFELQGQAEGSYFPLYSNGTAQCKKKNYAKKSMNSSWMILPKKQQPKFISWKIK